MYLQPPKVGRRKGMASVQRVTRALTQEVSAKREEQRAVVSGSIHTAEGAEPRTDLLCEFFSRFISDKATIVSSIYALARDIFSRVTSFASKQVLVQSFFYFCIVTSSVSGMASFELVAAALAVFFFFRCSLSAV